MAPAEAGLGNTRSARVGKEGPWVAVMTWREYQMGEVTMREVVHLGWTV